MTNEDKTAEALQAVKIVQKYLEDEEAESGDSYWEDKQGRGFRTDMGYFFEGLYLFEAYLEDRLEAESINNG